MVKNDSSTSLITFELHEGITLLTQQLSIKPLKIVNPKPQRNTAVCMLTNYGGGFVEGDEVRLEVKCKANTNSVISTQANTRVYESDGKICKQKLSLYLEKNAFHVFLNDPLVMHRGGHFIQESDIHIEDTSVLVFIDCFSAGRTANGEKFAFENYETSTKIMKDDQLIIWDNFSLTPKTTNVYSPAAFGNSTSFANVFLIGNEKLGRVVLLEKKLLNLTPENNNDDGIRSNASRINPNAFVCRYSSRDLLSLKKIISSICESFKHPELLNYNPLERKY